MYRRGSTLTNGVLDLWQATPAEAGSGVAIVQTPASEQNPALSPDGRWLAYVSDESGQNEVYVRPYPGPGGRQQISTGGGRNPVWAHRSQELFYLSENPAALMVASFRTAPRFMVESRQELYPWDLYNGALAHPEWDVAPDDQRILAIGTLPQGAGRQILVQNFLQDLR